MTAWVASHAPECTELTVERDRGFESRFLQRGVSCEPDSQGLGFKRLLPPASTIAHPEMRLHAEMPLVALLGLMHLGIPRLVGVLVEDGA
jgi:hypothetical protein